MVSLRSACFPLFATRPPLSLRRGHDEYEGWNATGWESTWLSHIWRSVPSSPAEFPQWLDGYMLNTKLDPDIHQSPLTVRTPTAEEVVHARAIGFKVRPATIASNHLAATLKSALSALGGRVVVINRRNRVKQAVSLYRRRVQGKGQFNDAHGAVDASAIRVSELQTLLKRRDEQAKGIECTAKALGAPVLRVEYEDLVADFNKTMRTVLQHLGVDTDVSAMQMVDADGDRSAASRSTAAAATTTTSATTASATTASTTTTATITTTIQSATTTGTGGEVFVKKTPDSLCDAVSNFEELCRHFLGTRVQVDFEPIASEQNCKCHAAFNTDEPKEMSLSKASSRSPSDAGVNHQPSANHSFCAMRETDVRLAGSLDGSGRRKGGSGGKGDGGAATAATAAPAPSSPFQVGALFGTHHKTGTVLLGQVLRVAAKIIDPNNERIDGPGPPHSASAVNSAASTAVYTGEPTTTTATTSTAPAARSSPLSTNGDSALRLPLALVRGNWSVCRDRLSQPRATLCLEPHLSFAQLSSLMPLSPSPSPLSSPLSSPLRLIHVVRRPLEVCVSGYQYHLRATEPWLLSPKSELGGASWRALFNAVDVADGVLVECVRTMPELMDMAQIYTATRNHAQVFTARLEDLERDFATTMREVFDFISPVLTSSTLSGASGARVDIDRLVRAVRQFDLSSNKPKPTKVTHVSSVSEKEPLRVHLRSQQRMREVLDALEALLGYSGYPSDGKHGTIQMSNDSATSDTYIAGADLSPECVFHAARSLVNDFWSDSAQQPQNIGKKGWHFTLA